MAVGNPGHFDMPAGEYRVLFQLELDDDRIASRSVILRVYRNMESRFEHGDDDRAIFADAGIEARHFAVEAV